MLKGLLVKNAWLKYADEVRRDPNNLYYCTRLIEKGYLPEEISDSETLMRKAALTVYKFDPLAYLTAFPHTSHLLSDPELEALTAVLVIKGDEDASNFLRGKLWSDVARCKESPERYARRGYEFLSRVSDTTAASEPEYIEALADCCSLTDYDIYKTLIHRLVNSQDPEWRGSTLIRALETAALHHDWETYDYWRKEWDLLPVNAHLCECYFNCIYTLDGWLALEREELAAIPQLLQKAIEVRGCPHLNSGAARMNLIELLIDRRIFLTNSLKYIEACENFDPNDERIQPLRKRIETLASASNQ
jgi:hypothetical protein